MAISNLRDITNRMDVVSKKIKSPLDDIPIKPTLPFQFSNQVYAQPFPFASVWAFYRKVSEIKIAIDLILKYANKEIKLIGKDEFENPDQAQFEFLIKLLEDIRKEMKCILADRISLNNAFLHYRELAGVFEFKHIPGYSMHVAKENKENIEWLSIFGGDSIIRGKAIPYKFGEIIHFKDFCLDTSHILSEPSISTIINSALGKEYSTLVGTEHNKNGTSAQGLLITPIVENFDEKEAKDKAITQDLAGYSNQSKVSTYETDEPEKVKFIKMQLELQANLYEIIQRTSKQDILDSFLIPAPLVGGNSKGVYTGTLEQYFRVFYNQVINPLQKDISDTFDVFFEKILGEKPQWKIIFDNGEIIPRADQLASLTNYGRMWMELMRAGKISAEEVIEKIETEEKKLKTLGTV